MVPGELVLYRVWVNARGSSWDAAVGWRVTGQHTTRQSSGRSAALVVGCQWWWGVHTLGGGAEGGSGERHGCCAVCAVRFLYWSCRSVVCLGRMWSMVVVVVVEEVLRLPFGFEQAPAHPLTVRRSSATSRPPVHDYVPARFDWPLSPRPVTLHTIQICDFSSPSFLFSFPLYEQMAKHSPTVTSQGPGGRRDDPLVLGDNVLLELACRWDSSLLFQMDG